MVYDSFTSTCAEPDRYWSCFEVNLKVNVNDPSVCAFILNLPLNFPHAGTLKTERTNIIQ